jgi:uncharacterized ferritin-like protein (DUF455 family)
MTDLATLSAMAVDVLTCGDGREKCARTHTHAAHWRAARAAGTPLPLGNTPPPMQPARPATPQLLDPRDVPRRRPSTQTGRLALLHALGHIELNAVDLHWDIIARFAHIPMPLGFYDDWVQAADDEAKHFGLVCDALEAKGSHYGAMPAHAGMWRAAEDTAHDFLARLAVVPMVLEARGLDVSPQMIDLFAAHGETQALGALQVIYSEEVAHVAYGSKWFNWLCGQGGLDPKEVFHDLVRRYFHGDLKPPFNAEKRAEAGIPPDFYWPLAEEGAARKANSKAIKAAGGA